MINGKPSRTSALTAYSASAGSGKTFRITREYLKLLLERPDAARRYRNILAVTFTNKATEEMKGRIVAALNDLAGSNEAMLQSFCEELAGEGISIQPDELQRRALEVRSNLLHDYSRFSVFTIDKFFQKVLHAFVNEAGLHPGFAIELDTDRLLEEAVSSMMENAGGNEQQMGWLMQLVQQRIDDGKSWNMKKDLLALGREIFKESFGRLSLTVNEHLNDKTFLQRYLQKLRALQKNVDDEMQRIAAQAQAYLAAQQLTEENFKGKSRGFIAHFKKVARGDYEPNVSTRKAVGCIEEWASKNTDGAQAAAAYEYLNPLLARACQLWDSKDYQTAGVILKNFMVLGLLTDIAKQMRSIANEDNLMPISDSVHLIRSLIDGSDAPFIYEKVGAVYHTFMIDEFQDTSVGQWRNFRPLVSNSLAEGNPNMVVGDVKQSIYRWRSGDWRILAYGIDEDLKEFGEVNRKTLDKNFRSLPQVVEFNNELFRQLSVRLQAELSADLDEALPDKTRERLSKILTNAYKDCKQLPQKTGGSGYVRVEFVEESEEKRAADAILERLPLQVAALQDSGYSAGDIAILTRNNRQGQMVADALIRYRSASGDTTRCFDVVSQDSLFLNASPVVRMAIALLRVAAGQQNTINEAFLSNELSQHSDSGIPANMHAIFFDRISKDEHTFLENLTLKSLPEAFEAIIQRYKLNELREELPFLQGLHDLIVGFANRKLSDAAAFLAWWDESGKSKPLYSPERQNAITIGTIHKSKGLQHKVVIAPFVSWELDTKIGSTVWMEPAAAPFNELPYVPLSYSDKLLKQTIFGEQQSEEKAQAYVDSLNLLYVALTRAEEQLYIFAPLKSRSEERKRAKNMAEAMVGIFTDLPDGKSVNFGAAAGRRVSDLIWEFGCSEPVEVTDAAGETSRDKAKENMNIPLDEYPSAAFTPKLRLRYEARELFEQAEPGQRTSGLLKHKIFERLRTSTDISAAIESLVAEGWAAHSDAEALRREVELALEHPQARAWFDGSWQVHAEAEILLPVSDKVSGKAPVKRPDRVMVRNGHAVVVDYKFGRKTDTSYVRQVEEYVAALRQMGYGSVEGYVWYVSLGEVQKVEVM
ncbi:MAG: UvrD-helicase domain-containing protein [Prevotellaceae bacterium]|jgi:ATP-dependent exoDNAse (exonuclease V) beta subunit|nr:UvrD-helicase domain-containing protein [Prevotellaceae bacterium]